MAAERMEQLAADLAAVKLEVATFAGALKEEKQRFSDEVNLEFARHKLAIQEVVTSARTEFTRQQTELQSLYQETGQAVQGLAEAKPG